MLPDLLLPSSRTLATLALFWESIELPTHESTSDPDEEELHVIRALVDEGIVNLRDVSRVSDEAIYDAEGREVAAVWEQTPPGTTIATIDVAFAEEIIRARARRVARLIEARAQTALTMAADLWAAPVAATPFGFVSSSLPKLDVELPVAEATLIHLAISGAVIDPATPVDKIVSFREQHKELAGRLRGALIDVAATIRSDIPFDAVFGQADAALKNRVEPALGALETELKRGRISFIWSNVLGVGGVLATAVHPTAATLGGGTQLVGQGIRYAFDRDALIRDHPFGYLHRVRTSFIDDRSQALKVPMMRRNKPAGDLATILGDAYMAAYHVDPRQGYMAQGIGRRSTDPRDCRLEMESLARSVRKGNGSSLRAQTRLSPE